MRVIRFISLGCLMSLLCAGAGAQSSKDPKGPEEQAEWWPEIDTYVGLNERMRLEFEVSRTTDRSTYSSATIGPTLQITLKPFLRRGLEVNNAEKRKYLTFGIGYRYIPTLDKPTENRVQVDLTGRYFFPAEILLSARSRVDIRDIGGTWSWRFRERLNLEHNFKLSKKVSIAPYTQGEIYYDSRYDTWNRNVYEFGFTLGVGRWLDIKPYYARSNDSKSSIPEVNAAGLTASFFFRNK